jgi:hypothetical protein
LYQYLQQIGFTPDQIDAAVVRMCNKRLIETSARRIPEPGQADNYSLRLTPVGLYHIDELLGSFTYLDAVAVDTPVLNRSYREDLRDAHSLEDRLQRALVFLAYLDECWRSCEGVDVTFDWHRRSSRAKELMERLHAHEVSQRSFGFEV